MFGWIAAGRQVGVATVALAAGTVRTVLGDCRLAFRGAGALCPVAAALALRIGTRPRPAPAAGEIAAAA